MLGGSRRVLGRIGPVCRCRQIGQLGTICLQILEGRTQQLKLVQLRYELNWACDWKQVSVPREDVLGSVLGL
jgi:hypothetical protein